MLTVKKLIELFKPLPEDAILVNDDNNPVYVGISAKQHLKFNDAGAIETDGPILVTLYVDKIPRSQLVDVEKETFLRLPQAELNLK